ncbi:MAG: tetratricopeptide repeat-containing sensor histidine kinase [bacterium]
MLLMGTSFLLMAKSDSTIYNYENLSENEKINNIFDFVKKNKSQYPDRAFQYANDALEISQKIGDVELIIKSEIALANCFKTTGDYKSAIEHFKIALSLAKKEDYNKYVANVSIELGDVYGLISKYNEALSMNLEALKINRDLNNKRGIAESYHNIAIVYYYILNLEKAREYNFQALKNYTELKDTSGQAKSLSNIALIYIDMDSLDNALHYNFKAMTLMQKLGNYDGIANAYTNIGLTYIYKKNYDEALRYLNMALEKFKGPAYLRNRYLVLFNISNAYRLKQNYQEALKFAEESFLIASKSQSPDLMAKAYSLFSDIYYQTKDFEKAYKYETDFIAIRDSIFNEANRNKISELEVRIETENKTLENELLRKTNRLQLILFIVASVLIIIILLVLFNRYKTKRHANQLLQEKNSMITEQNQSLERLNQELNEANIAKDKFFSIMAHDLKSPLWWFKNVTDLLSHKFDELSKEKIMEITKILDDSAQTSLHLIENLLQWSRSQSGRIEFIPEKINLTHVLKHIMAHYRLQAEGKNINVEINIPEDAEIFADKNMLYSILRNLISNAIKFSNPGGIITIDFKDEQDFWWLSVSDEGVGINPDDIPKIFRIDIQTTTLGTAQEVGNGLGLIITKEFIEKHGGSLQIESEPNKGSKFIFTILKK